MNTEKAHHEPVMVQEVLEGLNIREDGIYVDATYGGGGHTRAILSKLGKGGRLIAFDQDESVRAHVLQDQRLVFVPESFIYLKQFLRYYHAVPVDGILADLGVSSFQLDTPERGFSLRYDAPLDMRMDRRMEQTAADLLREVSEAELHRILEMYGEVRNARTVARVIVQARAQKPIQTTGELVQLLEPLVRGHRHQYLARVFQALRIAVNDELHALESFLQQAAEVLRPGGRLVVISFHSLEDRIVKQFMKGELLGQESVMTERQTMFRLITRKPLQPTPAEVERNPRSSSARLRVAEKLPLPS
ncbi:16S rRNA (cytosine(1402)-N(4))-methyltransferase RsmH [Thermoflavifilum thermophilum]|uniref:Ribosomal RNA small subunit methyltransferase H n=1 Tax=Thermoflavifilum thermophilum TaxID=1393122 RepID=A0A1I7N4J3_9BACT|nr:16S rRNA (cytosine(1402)-N(4))-methyltransferase RsmH [Thermoflavifilum thermophilum]SFV29513.1 16S rRNA (cytosine1402-N4)-methyltransferase [Thermoflavifilum thermophilum]